MPLGSLLDPLLALGAFLRASTSSFCCCLPEGAVWHLGKACQTNCSFPGLQQQGIFRVPGSQVEVNDIKNSFERGALAGRVVQLGWPGLTPLPVLWGAVGVSVCWPGALPVV